MLQGCRELGVDQNCALNPMEGLPDPKTAITNQRNTKNLENPENQGFPVFLPYIDTSVA